MSRPSVESLDETRVLAERGRWSAAADVLAHACDVLPLAIQAGQLLDQMVLVDYHPLRVRLRDGSGAQSQAARALGPAVHAAGAALWTALERDDLRVLDVLQRPNEHLEPYRYLTRLKSAGKLLQSFLFHHYTLVLGVLGTHSFGSLGYEMRELADPAVQPIFPETNQVRTQLGSNDRLSGRGRATATASPRSLVHRERRSGSAPPLAKSTTASRGREHDALELEAAVQGGSIATAPAAGERVGAGVPAQAAVRVVALDVAAGALHRLAGASEAPRPAPGEVPAHAVGNAGAVLLGGAVEQRVLAGCVRRD
jgi:hypothetical protein